MVEEYNSILKNDVWEIVFVDIMVAAGGINLHM
jgi:hypothetical protein